MIISTNTKLSSQYKATAAIKNKELNLAKKIYNILDNLPFKNITYEKAKKKVGL